MKGIYLDYAATTPVDPRVIEAISWHTQMIFGNPSSLYFSGRKAKKLLDDARQRIARIVGSSKEEIVFTSSGTEANNLAIIGVARALKNQGKHMLISEVEHLSVLKAAEVLTKEGFIVEKIRVKLNGIIDPDVIAKALRKDTILVSVIYANNEIGTIQPIGKISKVIKMFRKATSGHKLPLLHIDACQAVGALDINVQNLGVDLMTINGSKIYGPKATGALFVRRGIMIQPLLVGGSQERGLRAGTENAPLMVGFARALEIVEKSKKKENERLTKLRDYCIAEILKKIPDAILNGDSNMRLPNNISISFAGIDGEMLVMALDAKGMEVSTGSACTSDSIEPSHVIQALGLPKNFAKGNIRITLGRFTTKQEIEKCITILTKEVARLRLL